MRSKLDEIEQRLKSLIEKGSPFQNSPAAQIHLAGQLIQALQDSWIVEDGMITSPNVFTIFLHPDTIKIWENEKELLDTLSTDLQQSAEEAGLCFSTPPIIQFSATTALQEGDLRVTSSSFEPETHEKTAFIQVSSESLEEAQREKDSQNFLIINGVDIFPLDRSVINIGRNPENQIVLEDPRISRNHAQIRSVREHYVVFDLNSSGGTLVNGKRISQHTLMPGDVISLAGFPLIYGEDAVSQPDGAEKTSSGFTARVDPEKDAP
jgi:hypothetical protein